MTIQIVSFDTRHGRMKFRGIVTAEVTEANGVLTGKIPELQVEATGANETDLHCNLMAACTVAYDQCMERSDCVAERLRWAGMVEPCGT